MKKAVIGIWQFYVNGFRNMTWGRSLWIIILVKLFIMFCVLRVFFFPNFLKTATTHTTKEDYVSLELIHRAEAPATFEEE